MVRGEIIEEYPTEVKTEIDKMIERQPNAQFIFDWLEKTWFPKWKDSHSEWCVTKRTIQNYIRLKAPEKTLVHPAYVREAIKRTHKDIDVLNNIGVTIEKLDVLIKKFEGKELDNKDIGELRRLHKEFRDANKMLFDLHSRLGLIDETPKKSIQFSFSRKLTEIKEKREEEKSEEEKAYEKVIENQ